MRVYLTGRPSYYLLRPWRFLRDLWHESRVIWNRGTRGWANCDVWDVGTYLSDIIPAMLRYQKEIQHGHICNSNSMVRSVNLEQGPNCRACDKKYERAIQAWEMYGKQVDYESDLIMLIKRKEEVVDMEPVTDFVKKLQESMLKTRDEYREGKILITEKQFQKKIHDYDTKMKKLLYEFIDNLPTFWD